MDSSASNSDNSRGSKYMSSNSSNNNSDRDRDGIKSDSDSDTDGDNIENVNYMKKMCPCFVNMIKERNKRISVYKSMAINSNLELVKMNSGYLRKIRNLLILGGHKEGQQNTKHHGHDPLNIFPEEVWTYYLTTMFTDIKDLVNLSDTCQLFKGILGKTKNQWLFERVFPILFDKFSNDDILQIRLVCKKWLSCVDKFLENYQIRPTYSQSSIGPLAQESLESLDNNLGDNYVVSNKFQFDYNFRLPFPLINEPLNLCKNKFLDDMRLHETNPFIGRSVAIKVETNYYQGMENMHNFPANAKSFLEDFGNQIYHLSISNFQDDILSSSELWSFIILILKMCTNLKSFHIFGTLNWRVRSHENIFSPFPEELNRLLPLENLKIDLHNIRVADIQNQLVKKFSASLTQFEIQIWVDKYYHKLDWGKLRELQVNTGNPWGVMDSLLKTKRMGNLRKLSICLNANGFFPGCEKIVMLTKHFKRLNHLVLDFSEAGGDTFQEFCGKSSLPGLMAGNNNLTTLEVNSGRIRNIVSYDLLVSFPFLKSLRIKHHFMLFATEHYMSDGILNFEKYMAEESLKPDDYNLGGHIYGKSNIWTFLPFLKNFTVTNCGFNPPVEHLFTRQGYEYFWKQLEEQC